VLGLIFMSPKLGPLLMQVTAFTIAHSVTLALGIYGVMQVSPAIVEPLKYYSKGDKGCISAAR